MTPAALKAALRSELREKRRRITSQQAREASDIIVDRVITAVSWERIASLHTYLPKDGENEVDTWPLLQYVWRRQPHITTAVPLARGSRIGSARADKQTKWHTVAGGMPEPVSVAPAGTTHFDVIIVPALACDESGYRLGYGLGYYDRFLARQQSAVTIGLCYQSGLFDTLPREPHDVRLVKVVTEERLLETG